MGSSSPFTEEVAMNIVVCLKQVPAADAQIRVTEDGRRIKEIDLSFEMNEADMYALEAGLKLKDAHGGQVLVVSAGSRTESVLREDMPLLPSSP